MQTGTSVPLNANYMSIGINLLISVRGSYGKCGVWAYNRGLGVDPPPANEAQICPFFVILWTA